MIPKGYRAAAVLAVLAGGLGAFLVLDRDRPLRIEVNTILPSPRIVASAS